MIEIIDKVETVAMRTSLADCRTGSQVPASAHEKYTLKFYSMS